MFHPRAVRTPNGWSVVFADRAGGGAQVRAVAIGADGSPGEEVILAPTRGFAAFDVAESDSGFVLAWMRDRHPENFRPAESDILFRSFAAPAVPRQAPVMISMGIASQDSPVAAAGGGGYLAAWSERRGEMWQVRARQITQDGVPMGAPIDVPLSVRDQIQPSIDFNGESFLLVWSEGSLGREAVRAVRIDSAGTVLDPSAIEIAGEIPPRERDGTTARVADVAWSGTSWIIASEGRNGIELRRVSPGGFVIDAAPVVIPQQGEVDRRPLVDCEASGICLVVWQTYIRWGCWFTCPTWPDSVVAARVTRDLQLLELTHLMSQPNEGASPDARNVAVAWNEAQQAWMVVWKGVRGRRISRAGVLLDPSDYGPWAGHVPSVVSEGDGWRVLWHEDRVGLLATWTRTGFIRWPFRNSQLVASPPQSLLSTFLAPGPRPLALYVQSRPDLGNALRISGQFLPPRPLDERRRATVRR